MNEKNKKESLKEMAALKAAGFIKNGMLVGLGTGSTATYFIQELGRRVRQEKLNIQCLATSRQSEALARQLSIPLVKNFPLQKIDITVDGADEVGPALGLIKGLGGALLMEKIVAQNTEMEIIIADESKLVNKLGSLSPVPVEVVKFGYEATAQALSSLGFEAKLRLQSDNSSPFITDEQNYILDCFTGPMADPLALSREIKLITGVVDHGIFLGLAQLAIIARLNGIEEIRP
jgi:ribose 5-phosphate isomerase A